MVPLPPVGYPTRWEADVVLRDGGTAHVRPIRPSDAELVAAFHSRQSEESRYMRFFAPMPRLSTRDLERFTNVDHVDRVALVATVGEDIVGIARFDAAPARAGSRRAAEVAFNISDAHQGRGLGSVLLEHLAAAARERGIRRFTADVLPQNAKMIGVFREAGFEVRQGYSDGVLEVAFDIDPTERSVDVMRAREQRAEARSVQALLSPTSVVVVGASRTPGSVGHRLLADVVTGGFAGAVHAVNADAEPGELLLGVPVVRSVRDLPGPVDLAVVAVPAASVGPTVTDCASQGVRGLVVVSSGFAETGPEGLALQREVVRIARANGMRVVGPNSYGVVNTDPAVRLNASLYADMPPAGRFGLFSQSGALAVAVLSSAERRGLGLSTFVSAGNRADVSGNDLMQFWLDHEGTDAVGLYLESVGNPRKFSRVARALARKKPVVVVKSGASGFGVPPGHAVRASRAPFEAVDSMLRQAGVVRVENVHQLFDVAQVAVHQPLPEGSRVAIVGNSDALGTLAADACVSWGLQVAHGPVAVPSYAGVETFTAALEAAFTDPGVDAVVASWVPPTPEVDPLVAAAVARTAAAGAKTTVTCFLGTRTVSAAVAGASGSDGTAAPADVPVVPSYPTPEDAVRALAAVVRYAQWRRRDPGHPLAPDGVDLRAARALVERELAAAGDEAAESVELDQGAVQALLAAGGVDLLVRAEVRSVDEAVAAAERLGWPVALKTVGEELAGRQDLRGVRLGISNASALAEAVADMRQVFGRGADVLAVQRMAGLGVPCLVRSTEDPLFGPVVSFGVEGDPLDLMGDVAYRIPPLTDVDVAELVRSVKAAPKLFGHRGSPVLDVDALEDVVARVAVLADALPEVAELRLSPVLVSEEGARVLGASVTLAPPQDRADPDRRTLPT
ncbi:GNAT family N-acetyltransferase [Paenibacillus sp. TRM 82003]|uniref:bifunctional acetate--CoA ligase family protein/GNAT family N-acetyltransferase n=1 Tax=Kineococcus sp. TRM81007 TaxID=2925831 RepID=UPI001F57CF41|nr:GNAT family N-acetyltransferase [Kineococcus sp. TRM81007]MCI2240388.1 GNAT family N-acetyltransferase [Kineococcus sp. TRM81007]MCI3927436.1 GNAT family N-acetyltransferase [Paenibacillus sp. TRM 82003]